jgi:hypothetical protein
MEASVGLASFRLADGAVGRASATAGKRIRRIWNGDLADRSTRTYGSAPKRLGFVVNGLSKLPFA